MGSRRTVSIVARRTSVLAAAAPTATSSQRTYRYLRIGTAATVVAIFTAVASASTTVGVLPSVSAYYSSPARDVFVGALIAASLALFALSGRGPSRALLDAAALFAPLIALVPTTPPASGAAVETGTSVVTYVVIGAMAVAIAIVLTAARSTDRIGAGISIGTAAAVLTAVAATAWTAPDAFARWAHPIATLVFFALIAAVAVLAATTRADPVAPWMRAGYIAIAALLVVTGIAYGVITATGYDAGLPPVLVCEVAALTLFLAFWVLQTVQWWNDPDPAIRA